MKTNLFFLLHLIVSISCTPKSVTEGLIKFELASRDGKSLREIDIQEARNVLQLAEPIDTHYFWKSFRMATLSYQDGKVVKVRISDFGAFFYAEEFGTFYQFKGTENQKAWHDLLYGK